MDQEASFTFTTPLNVNIVEIKGVEHLFVEGDISTNDLDFVNDIMSKECQESMQKQVIERNMKLDIEHEAFKGKTHEEKEINKTKIPAGKLIDATVKDLGERRYSTRVKGEINIHNKTRYEEIKGYLLDKYLDAFSVAFLITDVDYQTINGKSISVDEYYILESHEKKRIIKDVLLLNVALTGNPCNTKAQMVEVYTKAMDAMEEYKKMKEKDPKVMNGLVVKSKENKKENPLSYIWNKISSGKVLDKKELKLLKAAIDVAENKGIAAQLVKEYYNKVVNGQKLSWKEYYVFKELIQIDYIESDGLVEMAKSNSISHKGDMQLNNHKNSKMKTEAEIKQEAEAQAKEEAEVESEKVEQKAMLKSVSEEMKSIAAKYEAVAKENVEMKEDLSKITVSLEKITKALEQPIHKSPGIHSEDAKKKSEAGVTKSVNPLDLF